MARVKFLFYLKQVFQPVVLEILAVVLFTGLTTSFVSVGHVLANSISVADRLAAIEFFVRAFMHTHIVVQLSILAAVASGMFLLRDIYRSFRVANSLVLGRQLA